MKSSDHSGDLPSSVGGKLRIIRRRSIGLRLLEGLILSCTVLLSVMLAAMIIDLVAGWFSTTVRYVITLTSLSMATVAFIAWTVMPLARRPTLATAARDVDQAIPQLEERWSTVTELSQNTDAPEVRGSEAMISKVASEAARAGESVDPSAIVPVAPVLRAGRWLAGVTAVLTLFFVLYFDHAAVLLQRFWMPGANISLTRVSASPADTWVPMGESLTISAALRGRIPPGATRLFLRSGDNSIRTVSMTAVPGTPGRFDFTIGEVTDSFEYRIRAGDGQTPWHRMTAVERPRISEVTLKVMPPAYTGLPAEEKNALPHTVRVLEGSEIEVAFRADQPLNRMLLDFGNGHAATLEADADNWYRYRARPTNSFTFAAAAINRFNVESRNKPSSRVTVYPDLPPSVRVLEPSDGVEVTPDEKVDVVFEATDDFGLSRAELILSITKPDGSSETRNLDVPLETDAGAKELRRSVQLDLENLGLRHGDQLSYVVQVTDTRQTATQAGAPFFAQQESAASGPDEDESATEARPTSQDTTETAQNESTTSSENQDSESASLVSRANSSEQTQESQPNEGAPQPPNEMAKRLLDVAQTATCQPRSIRVDEWAGTFDAEKRKKLEIAIDPVLSRLDELLSQAQDMTEPLKAAVTSAEGLQSSHAEPLAGAIDRVTESQRVIADLRSRTEGTPYAFVGLQLQNIRSADIDPAQARLGEVKTDPPISTNADSIEKASFHIQSARNRLAALTRTYESVKRDQQVADAMQRLSKMYQVFLEDTQALLGGSQPPINTYQRKIAEVDDAYVEKLKELLEEKKKIMAELAQLLSKDPRLLRRYLASLELQGTTYRDQMTLLAERQKELQSELTRWNATPDSERAALASELREAYRLRHRSAVEDAVKLRDNLETWLPLDVDPAHEEIKAVFTRAERIAQLAAESTGADGSKAGEQALEELRALREALPPLEHLSTTNSSRMTAYLANRLPEIDHLITAQSGLLKIVESLDAGDFAKVAEIVEHRIAQESTALSEKLEATEEQIASMSSEIAEKAALLNQIVRDDILQPQGASLEQFAQRNLEGAQRTLDALVPAFARAEEVFDELMTMIIARLDEAPAPDAPGENQDLESLLAMLEDEMKAAEGLGIPCRPVNVSIMRDWMRPGSQQGQGNQARLQAQAAQAQAQQGKAEIERLRRKARESAQKALAEARHESEVVEPAAADVIQRGEAWNKLASKLGRDLLQGRDNTPPEQYRAAIENYFRTLADRSATETNQE